MKQKIMRTDEYYLDDYLQEVCEEEIFLVRRPKWMRRKLGRDYRRKKLYLPYIKHLEWVTYLVPKGEPAKLNEAYTAFRLGKWETFSINVF